MLSITVPSEARAEGGACSQQMSGFQGSHVGAPMLLGCKTLTGRMQEVIPGPSLVPASPPLPPKNYSGSVC